MRSIVVCITLMTAVSFSSVAQKANLLQGNLKELAGQTHIRIDFNYDSMTVGNLSEKKYIEQMKARWDKEESGKGEKWEAYWSEGKEKQFEPVFQYFFSKESGIKISEDAPYTLHVKTMQMEPGWNIGIKGLRSSVEAMAVITKSDDPKHPVAVIELSRFRGSDGNGGDFEALRRIKEAYAEAGKGLGKLIKSKLGT
jgi:hypothetical protein